MSRLRVGKFKRHHILKHSTQSRKTYRNNHIYSYQQLVHKGFKEFLTFFPPSVKLCVMVEGVCDTCFTMWLSMLCNTLLILWVDYALVWKPCISRQFYIYIYTYNALYSKCVFYRTVFHSIKGNVIITVYNVQWRVKAPLPYGLIIWRTWGSFPGQSVSDLWLAVGTGQVFLWVIPFSTVSIIPPMLHTHSFTYIDAI